MSFRLDWKNFKKTGVENGIATLRHNRGHEIRVSLKSLPPGTRKLLEDLPTHMADGGMATSDNVEDSPEQIMADAKATAPVPTPDPAQSPAVAPQQPNPYADLYEETLHNKLSSNPRAKGPGFEQRAQDEALSYVEHQKAMDEASKDLAQQQAVQEQQRVAQTNARRQALGLPPAEGSVSQMTDRQPQGSAQGMAAGPANPPQVTPGAPGGMDNYMGAMQQGYQLQSKGIDEQKLADQQLGQSQAGIYNEQAQQAKMTLDHMQAIQADAGKERENFVKDVQKGYIQPNRVFENMGTGQKVLAAIGLMLSGGGSAAAKVPNAAMTFLQNQIDRDMKAQEANQATRESLLRNNLEFYKNKMDATNMTRIQINDYYAHLIDESKAKNMTPQAQAIADSAKGKLMQQNAALQAQMGIRPNGVSMDEYLNTMRVLNPARAKEIQERYIPGVGVASIPVSEDARKRIISHQELDKQIEDMQKFAKDHTGSFSPSVVSQGKAKALALQAAAREAILNTVYREGEQPLLDKIISSDPTSIFNKLSTLPKLNELRSNNQMKYNVLKQSYGLQPQGNTAPQSGGIQFTPKK